MSGPDTFTFTIPVPPSANALWRAVPGKGVLKSKQYRAWLQEAQGVLLEHAWNGIRFGKEPVRIRIVPPFNARRDIDNYGKATLDALVHANVLHSDRMTSVPHMEIEAGAKDQTGCLVTVSRIAPLRTSIGEG